MCLCFFIGKRPWALIPKIHIALPGATQNEVSGEEAEALVKAGVRIVAEGSNMGCTAQAIDVFEASRKRGHGGVWYAPGSTYFFSLGFASILTFFFSFFLCWQRHPTAVVSQFQVLKWLRTVNVSLGLVKK